MNDFRHFTVLGRQFYIDVERHIIVPCEYKEYLEANLIVQVKKDKPAYYVFCLSIVDACNLDCKYCFNKRKTGRVMSFSQAKRFLERLFIAHPDGEKYFVDLSGDGEPLLALDLILKIADWCVDKQNELRREVLVRFVCNGTLLTSIVAETLQRHGVLFGVSIDGCERVHDLFRVDKHRTGTYSRIIRNIEYVRDKDYVGCAVSIGVATFPLLDTLIAISPLFKTISVRPIRGELAMDLKSEALWEREYDELVTKLVKDVSNGDTSLVKRLMNGEDCFGGFVCQILTGSTSIGRCDQGVRRFAVDIDGNEFGCPALSEESGHKKNIDPLPCAKCEFLSFCGGECQVVLNQLGHVDEVSCRFRKHLIKLAAYYVYELLDNQRMAVELYAFALEKKNRYKEDKQLTSFLIRHQDLSFTEAKRIFDSFERRY